MKNKLLSKYSEMSTTKLLKESNKFIKSEKKQDEIGAEINRRFPDLDELHEVCKLMFGKKKVN